MTREYVTIPKEAWDFLNGQGELDGVSFGDRHPTRSGLYWWRSYIAALTAPPAHADDVALVDAFATWVRTDCNDNEPMLVKARTALLARLSQHRAMPEGWRDIESAPKDGTVILVWDKDAVDIAYWMKNQLKNGWWCGTGAPPMVYPTHWMPLPAAPKVPT